MKHIITPVVIMISGFLLGLIFESWVRPKIRKITSKTNWKIANLIIDSFKGILVLLFTLIGIYIAIPYLPLSPEIVSNIYKIILILAILSLTIPLMRFFSGIISYYASDILPTTTGIFKTIINITVFIIGLLVIFATLGIKITPILTALGIGGLAVALALQDTLSNLFAGFHLIAVRQIKPNNYIKLDSGEEGYVVDIGWRNTTIRMLPNNLVIIPNVKLASSIVTNYSLPEDEMAVLISVGVSYDSDLEKVERVTIEVAKEVMKEVPGGVPEFEPFIRYHTFGDFSINFSVIMRGKDFVSQYLIKHEFIKRLHKRYKKEGIEIPFPITTVYMKGGKR